MRWYWDRLRAMSPAEVVHRARMLVRPRRSYPVPPLPEITFAPELSADPDAMAVIRAGDREVLGLGRVRADTRFDDRRLEYELARGHDWVAMAGDRAWLDRELARWRRANPIGSRTWRSAMEVAIRIFSLAFARGPAAMIHEHAAYVADHLSAYSSANNHLIVELAGLVVADRVLGRHVDTSALQAAVAAQVGPDGVHREMATHYHAFVLEALGLVSYVERWYGHEHAWLERRIAGMATYLAAVGELGHGDDDGGRIVPALAIPAAPAPTTSTLFADSGQVVLRAGRVHATFDAGPFGFGTLHAHAHCDALALNVAFDGRPFLVDRGTYRYAGDRGLRDELRGTAAHNTLQVGTLEQATIAGPFLWRRVPRVVLEVCELGSTDHVVGSHDGFAPARHTRTIDRDGDQLRVVDRATTTLPVTTRFHFPPGLDVELAGARAVTERGVIEIEAGVPSLTTVPHSSRYGLLERATTLEVRGTEELSVTISPPARR